MPRVIVYGGDRETVETQLICNHDWHGPCIDSIERYFKCKKCFAMEYNCTIEEYYESALKNGDRDD